MKLSFLLIFWIGIATIYANNKVNINSGWQFTRSGSTVADIVTLPHSWNALDGQDGGNNYYRGIGW